MSNKFKFIPMGMEHIKEAAALRAKFQEFGYLSKISVGFWEVFLLRAIDLPEVIAQVAIDTDTHKLVGYIVGTTDYATVRKKILNSRVFILMGWYLMVMLINNPSQIASLVRTMLTRSTESFDIPSQMWITWIVSDECKKNGIGLTLYKHLCARMYAAGVLYFYGSVDCNNEASNSAHQKIGAEIIRTLIIDGRSHYLWKHKSEKWLVD